MNDRFKFRVWKKLENRMVEDVSYLNPLLLDEQLSEEAENNILMQSTGLKDKNGTLIYEGDIVNYTDDAYGLCKAKIEWDNARYQIVYYTGGAYKWFSTHFCLKHTEKLEVIGNVFENPELLEVQND